MIAEGKISHRYELLKPFLTERQQRLLNGAEAESLGRGGISLVSKETGMSRTTIRKGISELHSASDFSPLRSRQPGGGRKNLTDTQLGLEAALLGLVEPTVRGEPDSPLLWTTLSLRHLAKELKGQGYQISHTVVGEILKAHDFSLQANRKTSEGESHPDRDAQFQYIHDQVVNFQSSDEPVISVDTKKKELVGNFKNSGQEWRPKGQPTEVNVYDFRQDAEGLAIPYGIYDITQNRGWVNVGVSRDTAEFSVQTIRNWWRQMGQDVYPEARQLLITADGGGSNGSRVRLWKKELQDLADDTRLEITVCHFPPGTSKWNKIEHRLFSCITKNWRGKPLESYHVVVNLIASTKTETGLRVNCQLDPKIYEKGIKVSDDEFKNINLFRHDFHGNWNYTIKPSSPKNG
jgi:hypothetical protein